MFNKRRKTIDKVLKLEAEGEKWFGQHLLDKALARLARRLRTVDGMKYSEGQGRALTNMCRVYLERGEFTKAKYMGEKRHRSSSQRFRQKSDG